MQFLHPNETRAWCHDHGMEVTADWRLVPSVELTQTSRLLYAPNGSLGLEPGVALVCLTAVSPYTEALLWVIDYGVWPSSEDWPTFYNARGQRGERYSLDEKPGHLFRAEDRDDLRLFIELVLANGWDAHLLPISPERDNRRIRISHDGWAELYSAAPIDFVLAAV